MRELIKWSKTYKGLPWRKRRSLYNTLVSEIMLQQTTVQTVLNHFDLFLKFFPDLDSLAKASTEQVEKQWQGLGYYRRARNLHKAAQTLISEFRGEFPLDVETLKTIPGIGDYTANALIAIGANKEGLALDANLERVLARYYGVKAVKGPKLQKKLKDLYKAKEVLPELKKLGPRKIHEALMDLGRVYCRSKRAECLVCPLHESCISFRDGLTDKIPMLAAKKNNKEELELGRLLVRKGSKVLVYKKSESEWLQGQYELPTFVIKTTDKNFKQYPKWNGRKGKALKEFKTGITKYSISNRIYQLEKITIKELKSTWPCKWMDLDDPDLHLSTASRKALK